MARVSIWYTQVRSVIELLKVTENISSASTLISLYALKCQIRWINHCDPTFPGRFEEYQDQINDVKNGIWGTNPPKVLADVVEALIGAVHIDGGFQTGQRCVLNVLEAMTSVLNEIYQKDRGSMNMFMHPQQVCSGLTKPHSLYSCSSHLIMLFLNVRQLLMRLCSPVKIKAVAEEGYTGKEFWLGLTQGWCRSNTENGYVGLVVFHGAILFAAREELSRQIAKLRASSILTNIFSMYPGIIPGLTNLSVILQKRDKAMKEAKEVHT